MMSKKPGASLNLFFRLIQLAIIMIFFSSLAGILGCSDGGGGGGGSKSSRILTGYDGIDNHPGNTGLEFYSAFPWFVNLTYQVEDADNLGVSNLTIADFQVTDNGVLVDKNASEMNMRQRSSLPPDYSYELKTVLMIDNSPSSAVNLEKMIEAALVVIDNMDEKQQQQMAVVAFDNDGEPILLQEFTSDIGRLNTVVTNIVPTYGSTNFYGAVIYGLSLWEDDPSPEGGDFRQGFLVAMTDGIDTSSLYNVDDAIAKRKDKQVITVAVGDAIPQPVLDNLERLGNGGFYPVPKPDLPPDEGGGKDPASENLCEWMDVVQDQIIAYADAFYWIQYRSSATSKDTNPVHAINLSLVKNSNKDADATVSGTYSSENFFSGDTSIYFNANAADPNGLFDEETGLTETIIMLERGQGAGEVAETIQALTYKSTGASPSEYEWTSGDTSIVTVQSDSSDSDKATITVIGPGDAVITVKDKVNNVTQTFVVKVKIREESFEMIRHMVTSIGPWFADATFQVRRTPSVDNQWEWVTDLAREDISVMENGLPVDMEVSELNLRKRDDIPSTYSYVLKTVLLIDNSPSVRASNNLDLIKQAAKAFAKRALMNDPEDNTDLGPLMNAQEIVEQEIAVVSFDEDGEKFLVLGFTTDLDVVNAAIDGIVRGYGPIDFYGGMIDSLLLWDNDHNPYDAGDDFVQGLVIALSDGWQSNPGFYDRQAVLDETGSKQVVCVSVGDDLISGNSDDLIAFGNAGFYSVPDPGKTNNVKIVADAGSKIKNVSYTVLEQTLMGIQDNAVYPYANSFYWLNYKSYLDPAPTCNRSETMSVTINNNSNTAAGKNVAGTFESCEYFEGVDGMIYVNSTVTNPEGLTDDIDMEYIIFMGAVESDPTYTMQAFTYNHDDTPAYEWLVANENIVLVTPDPRSYANSRAVLSLPAAKRQGSTFLNVTDTGNGGVFRRFTINVSAITVPDPLVYYPFNGNLDDASGNGFDATFHYPGAQLTANRCGESDKAYAFAGRQSLKCAAFRFEELGAFDEITVCAWVKSSSSSRQTIITLGEDQYWSLDLIGNSGIAWITKDSADEKDYFTVSGNGGDNQWHFVCAWFKAGNIGTVDKKIYLDGQLMGSKNGHAGLSLGNGFPQDLVIGDNKSGTPNYWFHGNIDDIMIFDQALTDDQIKVLSEMQCIN